MKKSRTTRKRAQKGATIAEAAVTAVTLFTLILGVVDFGRAYSIHQSLTNAAREGARYAVAPDATTEALPSPSEVQAHVAPFLSSANITGTVAVDSTSHVINGVTTTYTKVTITAPYEFLFFSRASVNIVSNSEMRNETN
jgi:Flp pilus assembly protein TadG